MGRSYVCSGSVEVLSGQGWLPVCEGGFDSKAEKVVCREFGCGPPVSIRRSSKRGEGPVLSKMFQCKGNESRLQDCASSTHNTCKQAVGIACTSTVHTHFCFFRPNLNWFPRYNVYYMQEYPLLFHLTYLQYVLNNKCTTFIYFTSIRSIITRIAATVNCTIECLTWKLLLSIARTLESAVLQYPFIWLME